MTTAMYTPGPWYYSRFEEYGTTRWYVSQQDGAPYTPYYSDVTVVIAETHRGEAVKVQEANARLIAAAPCLLDALQEAKHMFAGEYPGHPTTQRIFAAIEKATGEPA